MKQGFRRLFAPIINLFSGFRAATPVQEPARHIPEVPKPPKPPVSSAPPQETHNPIVKAIAAIIPSRAPQASQIPVDQVAINTRYQRVKVMNPSGIRNGNGFHALGKRVAIAPGGRLRVVAAHPQQVLVEYQHPRRQGRGPEAGHGTLLLVPLKEFAALPVAA